ncbi:MAG: glycosyltransferase [Chitinophagales bacterium]|nr:glycosyltransferase [Chitinophagales bacterium]
MFHIVVSDILNYPKNQISSRYGSGISSKFMRSTKRRWKHTPEDIQRIAIFLLSYYSPIAKDPLLEINVSKKGLFRGHTWEQISLPYALRKQKTPLLLNLCNTAPVNYKNQIITLHDLAFIHHPQSLSPVFRAYYQWLIPLITRKALAIITISETIADEIQHVYRIPSSRIHIIYNTAEKKQMRPNNRKDFSLSVGSIQYRKNYQTIYDAFVRANTGNR